VASISETTTGDVLANDPVPAGTVVTEVNGVAVNSSGTTTIQGEYGTLTINSSGQYTYTLRSGVGRTISARRIPSSTPLPRLTARRIRHRSTSPQPPRRWMR
jgi:hypothetical protein